MAAFGSLDTGERRDRVKVGGMISVGRPILDFAILSVAVIFGQEGETLRPPGARGRTDDGNQTTSKQRPGGGG